MTKSIENFRVEFPEEHIAAIEQALTFIPPASLEDDSIIWYPKILNSLLSHFNEETVRNLLSKNVNSELLTEWLVNWSSQKPLESIDFVYQKAMDFGWSLKYYLKSKNKNQDPIVYKDLPVPECADLVINSRYVTTDSKLEKLNHKNLIIHSSHGTGKTEFVIEHLKGKEFIYITHREQLAREIHSRLQASGVKVNLYKDFNTQIALECLEGSLVICINSIHKLDKKYYENKVIVIDEFDQFVNHLHGKTCKKESALIFKRIGEFTSKSEGNIFLSADFPDIALSFIQKVLKKQECYYVFNKHIPNQGRRLFIHETQKSIISHMLNALNSDQKVSVASFSKKRAEGLAQALKKVYGDKKKIIYVVQDNKKHYNQEALLSNKALAEDYDVIIFSPVLSSGVDFNIEFSRYNYLLVNESIPMDHVEAIQMAHRFRNYEELHIQCDKPWIPETQKKENQLGFLAQLRKTFKVHKLYIETIKDKLSKIKLKGSFAFMINAFIKEKYQNHLLRYFFMNLINGLSRRGYIADFLDVELAKEKKSQYETVLKFYCPRKKNNQTNLLREIEKSMTFEMITSLRMISEGNYYRFKIEGTKSTVEQKLMIAYEIRNVVGYADNDPQSKEDLKVYIEKKVTIKKFSEQLQNYALLTLPEKIWLLTDRGANEKTTPNNFESRTLKSNLMNEIWKLIPRTEFKYQDLDAVVDFIKLNRERIERHLFKVTPVYIKYPTKFISQFLELLGIDLSKRKTTRARTNAYWVDQDDIDFIKRVMSRRSQLFMDDERSA
ncbi:plasmid replication protein, CyRepA1 family [Leptospira stimsonii]|uniref:Helicase ATP-binding domain-containing protein n=1 Tax=Leptospira stimsonii TaxID=2202203 RepID=A0ABY2N9H3_9LEPT|nr:plasmid replication protein, CyRepA1 family [Leptospira stimsonii]TGK19032.1 hypothetical protein EHO98_12095 [Leptospira stimsonii]TGM18961.1 hypothetical protein EHQ90_05390 [Leptospira stimsonii]